MVRIDLLGTHAGDDGVSTAGPALPPLRGGNAHGEAEEATEISDYGFVLLLKLVDLMERLDMPHKRREIEQISLVIARLWAATALSSSK